LPAPWNKHHRLAYVLLGSAGLEGEPTEQGVRAVFDALGNLMNIGAFPMDDAQVDAIWTEVWLKQLEDRRSAQVLAKALQFSATLRSELDRATAFLVASALADIVQSEATLSPPKAVYAMRCGQALGIG
jgi:hypothetical protein